MAKCPPAAAQSLPGGTWRGPGGSLRHPKSTPGAPRAAKETQLDARGLPEAPPSDKNGDKKRAKIAFRMENVDFLKSMLLPTKNHSFSCPRATKSHEDRAQTPSQTNFDDVLRPKSFEETPWSDHVAVPTLPGTPKERPRGPQGPPRAAKAISPSPWF